MSVGPVRWLQCPGSRPQGIGPGHVDGDAGESPSHTVPRRFFLFFCVVWLVCLFLFFFVVFFVVFFFFFFFFQWLGDLNSLGDVYVYFYGALGTLGPGGGNVLRLGFGGPRCIDRPVLVFLLLNCAGSD